MHREGLRRPGHAGFSEAVPEVQGQVEGDEEMSELAYNVWLSVAAAFAVAVCWVAIGLVSGSFFVVALYFLLGFSSFQYGRYITRVYYSV